MEYFPKGKVAGALFLVAATEFVMGLTIAEALYPGYSVSNNYISDLGIGPSSFVFNSAVFFMGVLILVGTVLMLRFSDFKMVNTTLLLMSIGSMGVGIFTKDITVVHAAVSLIAFFFSGLSAIVAYRLLKKPFSIISIVLGFMTLAALALFSGGLVLGGSLTSNEAYNSYLFLGLGPGGMERMIIYPGIMWLAAFGGYLLTRQQE